MSLPRQPKTIPPEMVRLSCLVTPEQHRALRVEAAERGMTLSALLVEALLTRGRMIRSTLKETP